MPTYVCVVKAGLLNNLQKHRIAAAITRLHSETTGAPTWLVQVVIDENEQRRRYLNGEPADHQMWIRGDIGAGRTSEQRHRLMLGIAMVASLRYNDTIAKINDAWFFAERLLYVDWIDERPLP